MQNALIDRCNMNAAAAAAVIAKGYADPADLMTLTEDGVKDLAQHINRNVAGVTVPFRAIDGLLNFRYWAILTTRMGVPIPAGNYDDTERDFVRNVRNDRKAAKDANPDDPEEPKPIKDLTKWRIFWDRFDGYMTRCRGAAEIPLRYVYRADEAVTPAALAANYATHEELYYRCTVLNGPHYTADNKRVFAVLKACTLDGPAWTFVRRFDATSNGRGAVLALRLQAEGGSAIINRKEKAYADLNNTRYHGERRNFGFPDYVGKHTDAHAELQACDEPMVETRKVTLFLGGIVDPKLNNGKDIVVSDEAKMNSFDATQQYLSSLVINKKTMAQTERAMSSVKSGRGRGGKGGGGGKKEKAARYSKKGNIALLPKYYDRKTWFEILNQDERDYVTSLKPANDKKPPPKRGVDEVTTAAEEKNDVADDNGDGEFGRNAHKKNKRGQDRNN